LLRDGNRFHIAELDGHSHGPRRFVGTPVLSVIVSME
jgi:hypothetical protein